MGPIKLGNRSQIVSSCVTRLCFSCWAITCRNFTLAVALISQYLRCLPVRYSQVHLSERVTSVLLTQITPLIMFSMWEQIVLTQASSLRFANHTSTRSFLLPRRVNSKFKCLKFLTRVPRGPFTVTSRLFSLIVTRDTKTTFVRNWHSFCIKQVKALWLTLTQCHTQVTEWKKQSIPA